MSALQQVPSDDSHWPEVVADDSVYADWWNSMDGDFTEVMDWFNMGETAGISGALG